MEFAAGNVFIRPNSLAHAGDVVRGHRHNFDHVTYIVRGAVHIRAVRPDGGVIERDFTAGEFCLVKAEVEHEITATVDSTLFHCIYAHRTPQGDVVQEFTGWEPAYV